MHKFVVDIADVNDMQSSFRLVLIPDPKDKAPIVMDMLFPSEWLNQKAENDAQGRTNREVQIEVSSCSDH